MDDESLDGYCGAAPDAAQKVMRQRREKALAEGYRDETCPKCGTPFEAQIHFIRCEATPCPMVSTKDTRTLLEQFSDAS